MFPVQIVLLEYNLRSKNGLDTWKEIEILYDNLEMPSSFKSINDFIIRPEVFIMSKSGGSV